MLSMMARWYSFRENHPFASEVITFSAKVILFAIVFIAIVIVFYAR